MPYYRSNGPIALSFPDTLSIPYYTYKYESRQNASKPHAVAFGYHILYVLLYAESY